jgi:hypothetical protein
MTLRTIRVVYPEGDLQEIPHTLGINQLVDVNGYPLKTPLSTHKIIAYRVFKKSTKMDRGEENIYYFLELVPSAELLYYTSS